MPWWARALRRAVMLSAREPLTAGWVVAYRLLARAAVALVARDEPRTVYLAGSLGSGELRPGISDLDVNVVLAPVPGRPGQRRLRAWRRLLGLRRRGGSPVRSLLDLSVSEETDLAALWGQDAFRSPVPCYGGPAQVVDSMGLRERPGLPAPGATWRRFSGPDRLPPPPDRDAQARRIAAWLELQFWWRVAFEGCLEPAAPRMPSLAVKLTAEPVRVLRWLRANEWLVTRRAALLAVEKELEGHAETAALALAAHEGRRTAGTFGIAAALPVLVAGTAAVAGLVGRAAEQAGHDHVRLIGSDDDGTLPLWDWRGRALASWPRETMTPIAGDPSDAATVAAAARASRNQGEQAVMRSGDLLVLPTGLSAAALLRAVACPPVDPVSFAVLERSSQARFPRLAGWSVEDCASRAVAEHAAWLRSGLVVRRSFLWDGAKSTAPTPQVVLGWLARAVAAAILAESSRRGKPELPVTGDAALAALPDLLPAAAGVVDEARAALAAADARGWLPQSGASAGAAASALVPYVRALPPYRG